MGKMLKPSCLALQWTWFKLLSILFPSSLRTCELALKNQYLLKIHACQRRYQGTVLKKYNIHHAEIIPFLEVPQLEQATKDMGTSTDQDKKDGPCQDPSPVPKVEQQDSHSTKALPSAVVHDNEEQRSIEEPLNPSPDTLENPSST